MDTDTQSEPKVLDTILSEAIDASYVDPSQPTETTTEAAPPPDGAPEQTETGRPRDDRGRFVSGEAKPSEGTAEASPTPAETVQPDPAATPIEAPRNFTSEQKAQFAKLNREAQEWVSTVEKEREAEYTRRSQETSEFRRTAEPLLKAVEPFKGYLSQLAPSIGQTPEQMITAILQTEYTLRHGNDAQRLQAFAQLAQTYGVNPAALTGGQVAAYQQPQQSSHDPVLAQRLAAVEHQIQQEREQQQARETSQQIEAFKAEKDDKGQPKYPHFERLRSAMALSLQSGECSTLPEAYAKAYEPIKTLVESELAARQTAVEAERKAALEKAKKAVPVRSSTGTLPNGATQPKGLDALLKSNIDRFMG